MKSVHQSFGKYCLIIYHVSVTLQRPLRGGSLQAVQDAVGVIAESPTSTLESPSQYHHRPHTPGQHSHT
jgi:hypothetical protein